jgi:hypothetical protein
MSGPLVTWLPILLSAGLLAALTFALRRVYALSIGVAPGPALAPEGWGKLDELLTMLLALKDRGLDATAQTSRETFSRAVVDSACRLMKCDRGSLMLWDDKSAALRVVAARSPASAREPKLFLRPGDGVAGKAFASGQAIFIADPVRDSRYVSAGAGDTEPFVSVPLVFQGRPIGVLNLHGGEGAEPFNDYNVKFLNLLAGEAALRLSLMAMHGEFRGFYGEMIDSLARAVDAKDAYPGDRSSRRRERARRLCAELALPDELTRDVEHAALLHDIGKLEIPETILRKAAKLSPEEFSAIRRHPELGHRLLSSAKFLSGASQLVLYHQERFDGRGYPEGLKGEDIPLGARIVSVLEAWEAMTSDRPYRKALSRLAAAGELRSGAGTQFDPTVTAALLRIESVDSPGEPA